jgi:hypothetical protein
MDPAELQAKATIAAALITAHAVDVPAVHTSRGRGAENAAAMRLRELTNYVFEAIVGSPAAQPVAPPPT